MAAASQSRAIFISYRRDDSEGESGRLFDDLVRAYGDNSVFMDVAGIEPGLDFRKAIDDNVASCGVLLAVIGPTWATVTGSDGTRRLDGANDFVRLEIASALKRGIPVIPVLVHDARMPALDLLPEELKDLRYRNSVELTHARWNSDVALLVTALKNYVTANADPREPIHANVPVQLPAPQSAPVVPAAKKSRMPLFAGLGAAVVVLAAAGFFLLKHGNTGAQQAANSAATMPATTMPVSAASATPASQPEPAPVASAPAASAGGGSPEVGLIGIWKKVKPNPSDEDGLEQLSVMEFNGQLSVRAYGTCTGKPCDWGMRKATMNGNFAVTEPWDPRNKQKETEEQRKVSVSMAASGDSLMVTVKNQIVQPSGAHVQSLKDWEYKKVH